MAIIMLQKVLDNSGPTGKVSVKRERQTETSDKTAEIYLQTVQET